MIRSDAGNSVGRIEGIDLIRGFAILLVLLRHAWPGVFGGAGLVGVVVFFGLSGYLITGVLMKDVTRRGGSIRYRHFYRNRAIRLLPALVAMLAAFAVIEVVFNILGDRNAVPRSLIVGLTYTMNLPGFDHGSEAVSHLWTLATEEQFYLIWPLILTFGVRFRLLKSLVLASAVAVMTICAATISFKYPEVRDIYTWPTSWAIVMVIGAASFLWQGKVASWLPNGLWGRRLGSLLALTALVTISMFPEVKNWPATYLVIGPVIGGCTVVLIFHLREWRRVPTSTLKPLLALGTISYAAYLWNYPIVTWLGPRPLSQIEAGGSIILTIAAATASWWVIERPFNQLKRYLDARRDPDDLTTSAINPVASNQQ